MTEEKAHLSSFPLLQDFCLYFLVGRLEEYSSQSLCLLPTALCRHLLLRLPVADIMKIEKDLVFMKDLDPDSMWYGLLKNRLVFRYPSFNETIVKYKSAKECYLSEVVLYILTSVRGQGRYQIPNSRVLKSHKDMVEYMLYGVKVESNDGFDVSQLVMYNSMDITWLVPKRYAVIVNANDSERMVQEFVNRNNWCPETIDLSEEDHLHNFISFNDTEDIQKCLSKVKTVGLYNNDYRNYDFPKSIKPLWKMFASLEVCPLEKVVFSACVTNLGSFLDEMIYGLFRTSELTLSGLRHIEILGNDGGTSPHKYGVEGILSYLLFKCIPYIDNQIGLETLIIEGLLNIVESNDSNIYISSYAGFEQFYNYLPYFIRKPSFQQLRLADGKIPINSFKSMISTFLSAPTVHDQCLQLLDCDIVNPCVKTYSSEFPLINQDATSPCVNGGNKTLCFKTSPLLALNWLLEYPMLQLKRLELQLTQFGDRELKALESYPRSSIDAFSCQFKCHHYSNDSKEAIGIFLGLVPISEIEIVDMSDNDDTIITVLATALMQPLQLTSLRRICLKKCFCKPSEIQKLLDVLFSRPKDQLADFSLEFNRVGRFAQETLLDSWRVNGQGQKLKSLAIVLKKYYVYEGGKEITLPLRLPELTEIAHDCYFY